MSDRFPEQMLQAGDNNLDPIAGAKLNFYITGTVTRKDTYSDEAKTTPNANPVVADAAGRFGDIFMDTDVAYKVVYTDAADVTIQTFDPFDPVRATNVVETPVTTKSSNFTVLASERGHLFEIDASAGSVNATLLAAATAGNNFEVGFKKVDSSSNAVTVDGAGAETIDDDSDQTLANKDDVIVIVSNGSEWHIKSDNRATSTPLPVNFIDGLTVSNNSTDSDHDIDIAIGQCRDSADAVNLELTSALVKQIDAPWVAGTNQGGLSSSLTLAADKLYYVHAIKVDGNDDIGIDTSATAANLVTDHSATAYREICRIRTDSSANIVQGHFTQVVLGGKEHKFELHDTSSGTAFDWLDLDGANIDEIGVLFEEVSLSGVDNLLVQIGDGSLATTGYVSTSSNVVNGTNPSTNSSTSGFIALHSAAGNVWSGLMILKRLGTTNTWISCHQGKSTTNRTVQGGGSKTLTNELDRVRVTRSGASSFDAGRVTLYAR